MIPRDCSCAYVLWSFILLVYKALFDTFLSLLSLVSFCFRSVVGIFSCRRQDFFSENLDNEKENSKSAKRINLRVTKVSKLRRFVQSSPTYIDNWKWQVQVKPVLYDSFNYMFQKSKVSIALKCSNDANSGPWSCMVTAELRLYSQKDPTKYHLKKVYHEFTSTHRIFNFGKFITEKILDDSNRFLRNDSFELEVLLTILQTSPSVYSQSSYVGIKNSGSTCYMNSLLQTLFFLNKLRFAVYQMPIESQISTCPSSANVVYALQNIFYDLQTSKTPVDNLKLLCSFKWNNSNNIFGQQDVQEFYRLLLTTIEEKMKGTRVEGTISSLFEGKFNSIVRCKNIDFLSVKSESFHDLQLKVRGKNNLYESLDDYTLPVVLEGNNKYDAEGYGKQDAFKKLSFVTFPPVLHLHLMRFHYDPIAGGLVKINDRFEYSEKLKLNKYLAEAESTPAFYTLHSVLVHRGTNSGGHYIAYISPKCDGNWFKFNDTAVSRVTKMEAIINNFGDYGNSESAYMLIYIRDSVLDEILRDVSLADIPAELIESFQGETSQTILSVQKPNDDHLYMSIKAYTESNFLTNQGGDLINLESPACITFSVLKSDTYKEALKKTVLQLKETFPSVNFIRLFPFEAKSNLSYRPIRVQDEKMSCETLFNGEGRNECTVFMQISSLPIVLEPVDILIFFKYYDVELGLLKYCGHGLFNRYTTTLADLFLIIFERACLPVGSSIRIYQEKTSSNVEPIRSSTDIPLAVAINELQDGVILLFESANEKFPRAKNVVEHLRSLSNSLKFVFVNLDTPNDHGFGLEFSMKMNFSQLVQAVAEHLSEDSAKLLFFKSKDGGPGARLSKRLHGSLAQLRFYITLNKQNKVYYQRVRS